jgi:predicted ABC-type transport system involved in lysophospholipase L1 biosynthesis ATPase subunit
MAVLLQASDLRKSYTLGRKTLDVLQGASLQVRPGETVAIVGISGAGKSTLLHILGGLDPPDDGWVRVGEQDLYTMAPSDRTQMRAKTIGFVFQSYHLMPEMDVTENVMLAGMAQATMLTSRAKLAARAQELLGSVGLGERVNHTPAELSGGEQQRVALARALMNDPELVLADEPTGNLDEATGGQVLDYVFRLVREHGRTLVMVTHNAKIAKSCDRVLTLRGGRLEG